MVNALKVLIIEDHLPDAKLMIYELEEAGFEPDWQRVETEPAYHTILQQALASDSIFDVILADYNLPRFDTLKAFDHLKKMGVDIPFIVVTGSLDEEVMDKFIKHGVDDYLIKDRLTRLGSAVEQVLSQKKLRAEKRKTDKALRESEERCRRLIELSPDGIAIHCEEKLVFINSAGAKLIGAAVPENVLGQRILDFIHPDDRETTRRQAKQVIAGQTTPSIEQRFIRLDGMIIDVEVTATPFTYREKPAIQVVFRDISARKQAEMEILQRNRELLALQYAGATIASSLDLPYVLNTVTREMVGLLNAEACIILEWNEAANKLSTIATYGVTEKLHQGQAAPESRPAHQLHIQRVLTEHQAYQVKFDQPDIEPAQMAYLHEHNLKILLMLPMKFQDKVVGLVQIQDTRPKDAFTDQEIRMAQLLANQAAAAIQNARLHSETEQRAQQLAFLHELDRAISANLRLEDIYHTFAYHAIRLLPYDRLSIALQQGQSMLITYVNDYHESGLPAGTILPLQSSAVGWVTRQGQPLVRHDITTNMRFVEDEQLAAQGLKSMMIIPLRIKGQVTGAWEITSKEIAAYDPHDGTVAQSMADQLSIAIENARLYQQAKQEIVERKQAEAALRVSEERFRQVISSISDHIYMTKVVADGERINLYISPNVKALTGYPPEKFLHDWHFWPLIIHSDDQAVAAAHAEALHAGQDGELEYRLIRADGNIIWVRDSGTVKVEDDFKIVYGVVSDITERKYRERELEAIAKMATALRTAITSTDMLPIILDQLLDLLPAEGAALEMCDAPHGESVIELARGAWIDVIGTRAAPNQELVEDIRTTGQPYVNNQAHTAPELVHPNLQGNLPAVACVPLIVQEQFIGILWVGRNTKINPDTIDLLVAIGDIAANALYRATLFEALQRSNQELAEERASLTQRVEDRTAKLSAANAELARASRLKDEFLASMSHELRTPLNTILGMAEVLRMKIYGVLNEEQVQALGHVEESGRHLLALINDILDLSKIEANKLDLDIRPVLIDEVCQASLRFIHQLATNKQIKVSFEANDIPETLPADELRLKQILVNLLSNAVKFTPKNGRVGLVVKSDPEQKVVRFTVWDTGIGISKQDMKRLFKPFVQIDSSLARQHGGTGLGLSLVYRLTEMHGGSVSLESQIKKGSRFTVSLPWQTPDDEFPTADDKIQAAENETEPQAVEVNPQQPVLVLLVEDNETNIVTVQDYLNAKGYHVITAREGTEAIERAQEEKPDIILMDIQMPGMDGLEATQRIRADEEIAHIPIIALTALAMPGDRERCLAAGVDDYLSKPVRLKNLVAVIETQLEQSRNVM